MIPELGWRFVGDPSLCLKSGSAQDDAGGWAAYASKNWRD